MFLGDFGSIRHVNSLEIIGSSPAQGSWFLYEACMQPFSADLSTSIAFFFFLKGICYSMRNIDAVRTH